MQVQRIKNNNYNTSFMSKNLTNKKAYANLKKIRRNLIFSIVNNKYDEYVLHKQEFAENMKQYPTEADSLPPLRNIFRDMSIKAQFKGAINVWKFIVKDFLGQSKTIG